MRDCPSWVIDYARVDALSNRPSAIQITTQHALDCGAIAPGARRNLPKVPAEDTSVALRAHARHPPGAQAFNINEENGDIGWRDTGNARRLTERAGAYVSQLLPRFSPQAWHRRIFNVIRQIG